MAVKTLERSKIFSQRSITATASPTFLPSKARCAEDEQVECIRKARLSWEQGINEELHAIAQESKRPFLIVR